MSDSFAQLVCQFAQLVWCINVARKKDKSKWLNLAEKTALLIADLKPFKAENRRIHRHLINYHRNAFGAFGLQRSTQTAGFGAVVKAARAQAIPGTTALIAHLNDAPTV